jgi:hypothetical protein
VLVSAVRGTTPPSGNVKLLKGADARHASVISPIKVPEYPGAVKATLWFSTVVSLSPVEGYPGTAIAETGPWQAVFQYQSPADVIDPSRNRKHPFETVSYIYKNHELGYSLFVDECASCTTPANVVQKLGSKQKTFRPATQQKRGIPARTAPAVRPGIPGKAGI